MHTAHSNSIDLLDLANDNDVIIICFPNHTTQALQPLDQSFFKPLKTYYNQEVNDWMLRKKDRTITKLQAGSLIGQAWWKVKTVGNATSGFKTCGIFPLNPNIIPDHFFAITDMIEATQTVPSTEAEDPTTFRETGRSSEDTAPSTFNDTVPFIKVQRSSTSNRMTTPADKETATKILEIKI